MAFLAGFGEAAAEGLGAAAAGSEMGAGEAGAQAEESWGSTSSELGERPGDASSTHPDGHQFQMGRDALTELLHSPEAIAALQAIASQVTTDCNNGAQIEGAKYESILQQTEGYVTPQVLVMPANYTGVIDDAAHSTMMVAAGNAQDAQLVIGFIPETDDPEYPSE